MRIKKVSSTSVLKGNIIDSLDSDSTVNAPSIAAVKRGTLSYIDKGYPNKPTGFTIVKSLPDYQEPGVIYFVCPIPSIYIGVSVTNYMGTGWVADTDPLIIKYDDANTQAMLDRDFIELYPNTDGYGWSYWNLFEKDPFPNAINLGINGNSTSSIEASWNATLEQRNPKTTALEWWGTCNGYFNGNTQYIEDNQWGAGGTADLYLSSNCSYTLSITVNPEGGVACLKGDTFIKTPQGRKRIKDIQIGDTVIDKENKQVLVTKIYNHDVDFLTMIRLSNGAKIETSLYHKFETDWGIAKSISLVKDMKLKCGDGSTFKIMKSENIKIKEPETVYEIMTETGSYQLDNGVINICEEI